MLDVNQKAQDFLALLIPFVCRRLDLYSLYNIDPCSCEFFFSASKSLNL